MKTRKTKKKGIKIVAKTNYGVRGEAKEVVDTTLDKPFLFSLNLGGKILKGTGATALEALRAIPVPQKIMSKGILTITKDDQKKEMMFMPSKLKRLFYFNAQPILIKYIQMGMKKLK